MNTTLGANRLQDILNHPKVKLVVNKKTAFWFMVVKIVIYILLGSIYLIQTPRAEAARGLNPSVTQVKAENSAQVYYLDHESGLKKAYTSEKAFLSYGNHWSDVQSIEATTLKTWPDALLIKTKSSPDVYYIKGQSKAKIKTESDLRRFGLAKKVILTVNSTDFNSYKTINYSQIGLNAGAGGDNTLSGDTGLIAEIQDFEHPLNLAAGSEQNEVMRLRLVAGDKPVTVRGLVFDAYVFLNADAVKNLTLVVDNDRSITSVTGSRLVNFNFGQEKLVIPANSAVSISIYADLNNIDVSNVRLKLALSQGASVLTDTTTGGDFPLTAPEFILVNAQNILGKVKVEELPLTSKNIVLGTSDTVIDRFKITEASGNENATIKRVTLSDTNSIPVSAVTNFRLKDNSNNIVALGTNNRNNEIVFNFNSYQLKKNTSKTFTVIASINEGADRQLNYDVKSVLVAGSNSGLNVQSDISNDSTTYPINRLPVAVEAQDLITTTKATLKQSGVVIGHFRLKNGQQQIKLSELKFTYGQNAIAPAIPGNLFLVNYQTGEILDNQPASRNAFQLHDYSFKAGQVLDLGIVADLPDDIANDDWYWINLNDLVYRYQNGALYTDNVNILGNIFYGTRGSAYLYKNDAQTDKELNLTRGQKQVKIASFYLEAADAQDIIIKNISLKQGADATTRVLSNTGFSNLKLTVGYSAARTIIVSPTSDFYQFNNINYRLTSGKRVEVKVYADISKDATANEAQLAIDHVVAISAVNTLPVKITGEGLSANKVAIGGLGANVKIENGGTYSANTKNNILGTFTVTNLSGEPIRLGSLTLVSQDAGFSYSNGFSNLRVIKSGTKTSYGSLSRPTSEVNKLSLNSYKIETGQAMTFDLTVDAATNVPINSVNLSISQLEITGYNSSLKTTVKGDDAKQLQIIGGAAPVGTTTATHLSWPTLSHQINYYFNDPNYPYRDLAEHNAIDIGVPQGSTVYAAADGQVIDLADNHDQSYNFVTIQHANGLATTYGHLSRVDVTLGQHVTVGQRIGLSGGAPGSIGSGAYTSGAHLHFEVILDGVNVDPLPYLR